MLKVVVGSLEAVTVMIAVVTGVVIVVVAAVEASVIVALFLCYKGC